MPTRQSSGCVYQCCFQRRGAAVSQPERFWVCWKPLRVPTPLFSVSPVGLLASLSGEAEQRSFPFSIPFPSLFTASPSFRLLSLVSNFRPVLLWSHQRLHAACDRPPPSGRGDASLQARGCQVPVSTCCSPGLPGNGVTPGVPHVPRMGVPAQKAWDRHGKGWGTIKETQGQSGELRRPRLASLFTPGALSPGVPPTDSPCTRNPVQSCFPAFWFFEKVRRILFRDVLTLFRKKKPWFVVAADLW